MKPRNETTFKKVRVCVEGTAQWLYSWTEEFLRMVRWQVHVYLIHIILKRSWEDTGALYLYNIIILHVGFHNLSVVSKEQFFSRFFDASFGSVFFPVFLLGLAIL